MGATIEIETHMLGDQRVGQIVGPKGLDAKETIDEAIKYGYVIGKTDQILANVKGVLKAMNESVSKDGNGRKVDGIISFQPVPNGRLDDITDPYDPSKISVYLNARTHKDLAIDTSDWTIAVSGSWGSLAINSISSGEKIGEIVIGEAVSVNGEGFDPAAVTVKWSVPGTQKSGQATAAQVTGDATRLTIAAAAFSALTSAEAGKSIVFDITCGNRRAKKPALLVANS